MVLKDGFSVASGGKLVVGVDPSLDAPLVREYQYQDVDYFLTSATGPWGSLAWSYDQVGNRLTETDNGLTDTYSYTQNGVGGNTALLSSIALGVGGIRSFDYTPAGHQTQVNSAGNVIDFAFDAAGPMSAADSANGTAGFLYDGRSYLRQAGDLATVGTTIPTYDSAGRLHCLLKQPADLSDPTRYVTLYLAGRPVGQVAIETGQADRGQYLTTDHLGTPLVATDSSQTDLWLHRFTPFGEDPLAGTSGSALANEVFLRFPGQWEDEVWLEAMRGAEGYYNLHRWYTTNIGRYSRVDPVGITELDPHPYVYVHNRPLMLIDPLGLRTWPFGAGQFCRDDSCQCINPPVRVLGEDTFAFEPLQGVGQCVDADAVYSAECVVKIPDNFTCTLKCDPSAPAGQEGKLECRPKGLLLGAAAQIFLQKKPECFSPEKVLPPGWPPNPIWEN